MRGKEVFAFEFLLLGPLEVRRGGEALALGGGKLRALLALLLLNANEVVSRDRLIEGVWGESQPSTINAVLNVYLSKLRKLLGSSDSGAALLTRPHGYLLRLDPVRLDLHRFESLMREGREALDGGRFEAAAASLAEALVLWRGPPLADLEDAPFAAAAAAHLDELRFCALQSRIDADLALGRHLELVPELEALVAEHPLRERSRAHLMVALYRTGRQSEALQVYRDARRLLAEELGIDPGPELQSLERAILVQDPALGPPSGGRAADEPAPGHRPAGARLFMLARPPAPVRRPLLVGALVGIAAVGIAIAVPIIASNDGGGGPRSREAVGGAVFATGNDVAVVQPETSKVVARVPVGSNPTLIRDGDGSVWVANQDDHTVTQIDLESKRAVRTYGVGFRPDDLAAGVGTVWAFDKEDGVLVKLASGYISGRFEGSDFVRFDRIAVDEQAVWLSGGKRLIRVDAETGRVVQRTEAPVRLNGLAIGANAVWAVSGPESSVFRIDPLTGAIRDRIPIVTHPDASSPHPIAIAADDKFVWVLSGNTATVTKIDPALPGIVATLPLGEDRGWVRLTASEGAAWVSNEDDGTLTRIDAATDAMTSTTVAVHSSPQDVAVAGGLVWVSVARG
jgi:DNA-binding SARP family transcriptional activator